ncbi:MAG: hypothetical protein K8R99_11620 [Actinomycetia bacterium]|nr:hypothetical protein [Actinomycetes bacterium]
MKRKLQAVALLVVGSLLMSCTSGGDDEASPAAGTTPAPADSIPEAESRAIDEAAVATAIAASGIGVVEDPSIPASDATLVTVTQWQMESMSTEVVSRVGLQGYDLDAMAPMPAGAPPTSYLVASWLAQHTTAKAQTAAAWFEPDTDWTHAQDVVYPRAAILLFVADVAEQIDQTEAPLAEADQLVVGDVPTTDAASGLLNRAGVCSEVSGFLSKAFGFVFNSLRISPSFLGNGVFSFVGSVISGIWNFAIDLAAGVVNGLVKNLTEPVIEAIGVAFGVLAVVGYVTSLLSHWGIKAVVEPEAMQSDGSAGEITVGPAAGEKEWPQWLDDCSVVFTGTHLPQLLEPSSKVDWHVNPREDGHVLIEKTSADDVVPASRRPKYQFTTVREEDTSGPEKTGSVYTTVVVHRPEFSEIASFGNQLIDAAFAALTSSIAVPGIKQLAAAALAAIREAVMTPFVRAVSSGANELGTSLDANSVVIGPIVTYHEQKATTTTSEPEPVPPSPDVFCRAVGAYDVYSKTILGTPGITSDDIAAQWAILVALSPDEIADEFRRIAGLWIETSLPPDYGDSLLNRQDQHAYWSWVAANCTPETLGSEALYQQFKAIAALPVEDPASDTVPAEG